MISRDIMTNSNTVSNDILKVALFFALLQFADMYLTLTGIERFGLIREGNLFLRKLMLDWGVLPTLCVTKSCVLIAICNLVWLYRDFKWIKNALIVLSGSYILTSICGWVYILS